MIPNWFRHRFWKATLTGMAFGLALFAFTFALDFLVLQGHDLPRWTVYLADGVTGVVAIFLFVRVFTLQAAREARTEARLHTIAEMNHHIRNALQVLSYWGMEARDQEQVRMVRDAVDRIEWALSDLLPKALDARPPQSYPPETKKPPSPRSLSA